MIDPNAEILPADLRTSPEETLAALYDRHARALLRVAWSIVGSTADAEDAVQDTFVALVRARDSLGGVHDLRAYLFAALRRAAWRRAQGRRAETEAREELGRRRAAPEPAAADPADERLAAALRALPLTQREVLALKIDGGLTFEQIGAALDESPNTAASRYRYALEKLRDHLRRTES